MFPTRSAIILYSKIHNLITDKNETYILTGDGANGITSIGGRSKRNESKYVCAAREAHEETRGVMDYTNILEIFTSNLCTEVLHANCSYFMIQVKYEDLFNVSESFSKKDKEDSDELKSLVIFNIDDLIWNILKNPNFQVNSTFKEMYTNFGHDWLSGSKFNKEIKNLDFKEFQLCEPLDKFPPIVSIHPFFSTIPKRIYAKTYNRNIPSDRFVISNQYYGFINGEHLFAQ